MTLAPSRGPSHAQLAKVQLGKVATPFLPAENAPPFNQTVATCFDAPFARPDTRDVFR